MQMDVVATTKRSVAVVLGVVVVLILVLLAWIGGETHYRSCLDRVALEYPIASQQPTSQLEMHVREEAIGDCSRWPG